MHQYSQRVHPAHPELKAVPSRGGGGTLRWKGTLIRPERYVNPPPLLRTVTLKGARVDGNHDTPFRPTKEPFSLWGMFAKLVTCCVPPYLMSMCGIKGTNPQQAWREKVTLFAISMVMCGAVLFFVMGLNPLLCPPDGSRIPSNAVNTIVLRGKVYDVRTGNENFRRVAAGIPVFRGEDLRDTFMIPDPDECDSLSSDEYRFLRIRPKCENAGQGAQGNICLDYPDDLPREMESLDDGTRVSSDAFYGWNETGRRGLAVFNGVVLNLNPVYEYIDSLPEDEVEGDEILRTINNTKGRIDISRDLMILPQFSLDSAARACFTRKFYAGRLDTLRPSCVFATGFSIIASIIILAALISRLTMAILFDWFLSDRLSRHPPKNTHSQYQDAITKSKAKNAVHSNIISSASVRSAASSVPAYDGPPPVNSHFGRQSLLKQGHMESCEQAKSSAYQKYLNVVNSGYPDPGSDLYTVLFVACYSENEASLRTTIESLAATDYKDSRKLLFIVADGLITGRGNDKSTPDIVINMIRLDTGFGLSPKPYSYISIASGSKQHNMARVYAGHFLHENHVVPTIIVVKCGTPNDVGTPKPGNRGKRDSQIILMNFFSRVILNDRMTPLDFDLFRKITYLMEATPDCFEMVVMVDADTRVHPMCVRYMVNSMLNDQYIMGLCGETRIANKFKNWVTAIQVFEYYTSHHLGKAFESVFGGVTCLPGCFCVYRIKVKKDKEWIPILANPDIIETYSANEVDTLHQKNLLLLGEDRFLTTFMIRTFPTRKMVFIPDAICKTVVPDDFKTLVSQRRRWINSTVHNLMELVLVNSLCGTFCFSMQFIVLLDLISTMVLPASIASTLYFAVHVILRREFQTTGEIVNIGILLLVIFFPILIVLFSGKRWHYLIWMLIYILALPIWNFVLPVYAFWHFDDFSWGATRKVTGGSKDKDGHGTSEGIFDASKISLKRWAEYERAWRKNMEKKSLPSQHMSSNTNVDSTNYRVSVYAQQEGTDFMPGGEHLRDSGRGDNSQSAIYSSYQGGFGKSTVGQSMQHIPSSAYDRRNDDIPPQNPGYYRKFSSPRYDNS